MTQSVLSGVSARPRKSAFGRTSSFRHIVAIAGDEGDIPSDFSSLEPGRSNRRSNARWTAHRVHEKT